MVGQGGGGHREFSWGWPSLEHGSCYRAKGFMVVDLTRLFVVQIASALAISESLPPSAAPQSA